MQRVQVLIRNTVIKATPAMKFTPGERPYQTRSLCVCQLGNSSILLGGIATPGEGSP